MTFLEWLREEKEKQPFGLYVARLKFAPEMGAHESESHYYERLLPFVKAHAEVTGNAQLELDFYSSWSSWLSYRQLHN